MNRTIVIAILLIGGWLASGTVSRDTLVWGESENIRHGKIHRTMDPQALSRPDGPRVKSYRTGMRRDPFVPPNRDRMSSLGATERSNVSDWTTMFPKVLGIVRGQEGFRAVLQWENSRPVFVRPGSFLENEDARVLRISDDAVFLEYRFEDRGRARVIERRLSIHGSNPVTAHPQG